LAPMVTGLEAPLCAAAADDDEEDDDDWPMLRGGATPMRAPLAPMTSERARGKLPSLSRHKEYMRRQRTKCDHQTAEQWHKSAQKRRVILFLIE
jgi:hypothetical protein